MYYTFYYVQTYQTFVVGFFFLGFKSVTNLVDSSKYELKLFAYIFLVDFFILLNKFAN